jgi:alanine-glyoxylate transaminase/serine-glyoxylate transaminase/serine-pyruvate transaminase
VISLVEPGEKVVALVNGFFSERLAEIAEYVGAEVVRVEAELGTAVDPARLDDALKHNKLFRRENCADDPGAD